jgi:dGTPase
MERLTRMFEFLMENPDRLPPQDDEVPVSAERAVCDFIAGMTDRYFIRTYEKYFGSVYMLFQN